MFVFVGHLSLVANAFQAKQFTSLLNMFFNDTPVPMSTIDCPGRNVEE